MVEIERDAALPATAEQAAAWPERARLSEATAGLHAAIDALSQAFLVGGAIERAEARDRFELALATYTGVIDAS